MNFREFLLSEGFSIDKINKIITVRPQLLSLKKEILEKKLMVLDYIGIDRNIILDYPDLIMQSAELTYARYRYLSDSNYDWTIKDLAYENGDFYRKHFARNNEVLSRYPISDFLNEKTKS